MLLDLIHRVLGKLNFNRLDGYTYKGPRPIGAIMYIADVLMGRIVVQELIHQTFSFSHRLFDSPGADQFIVKEKLAGLRLEAVLSGGLEFSWSNGQSLALQQGQYHFSEEVETTLLFQQEKSAAIFVTYLPQHWVVSLKEMLVVERYQRYLLSPFMIDVIDQLLKNDYSDKVRKFYYEKCMADLVFYHLMQYNQATQRLEGNKTLMTAVLQADTILSEDLSEHYTIPELARLVGTNSATLKKEFHKYFKMGIFERLQSKRLAKAGSLLSTTDLPIQEIAFQAGYQHVAGFIKAFKKKFGASPREWRAANRSV